MKRRTLLLLVAAIYCCAGLSAQTLDEKFASTNGAVNAIAQSGDTVYIGGSFTQVGLGIKGLARFKPGSTKPDDDFPQLGDADVRAVEPDESGGFYISGMFSNFNGTDINSRSVIHVLKDGTLDNDFVVPDWTFSSINALKKIGSRLYVGGEFYYIQGEWQPYLAALSTVTGALENWKPDAPNYSVNRLEGNDSVLFIGGYFDHVGKVPVSGQLAALSVKTGKLITSFPNANGAVRCFTLDSSNTLYLGGDFSGFGYTKQGLSKTISSNVPLIDANFPATDGNVWCVISDTRGGFYVGGSFNMIGNVSRSNIAHILPNGNIDIRFYVNVNNAVNSIVLDGNSLFFGGDFTSVNGIERNHIAAVAAANGSLSGFNPNANGAVNTIAIHGDTVYMGGRFTTVKGKPRNYAAAITKTNVLTTWAPEANNYVNKIVLNSTGKVAYLGGNFSTIKSKPIPYLAKVNTVNGKPFVWNATPDGLVRNLILYENVLYVRGAFYNISNNYRVNFAAIDTATGSPTAFNANVGGYYYEGYGNTDMSIANGKLYVGGNFSSIQGLSRNNIARVDLASGMVDNWNEANTVSPNNTVFTICVSQDNIIFGGSFNFLANAQRSRMAAIDASNNSFTIKKWQPDVTFYSYGSINDILHYKNEIFVSGNFQYAANPNGNYPWNSMFSLMALNDSTAKLSREFTEYPNSGANELIVFDDKLIVTGWFNQIQNVSDGLVAATRYSVAAYNLSDLKLSTDKYDLDNSPKLMVDKSGNLIAAGNFTMTSLAGRFNLAAINMKTGLPTEWNPFIDGHVYALAIQDSVLFAGGNIYRAGSDYISRHNLVAIHTKTGEPLKNWAANADNEVYALALKDKVLYVGGAFSYINDVNRNYAAALSAVNGAVRSWNPQTDNVVRSILPLHNNIYLGGSFYSVKGNKHQYLVKVNSINGNPLSWQPNPDGEVYSIINSGRNVFVGGAFQQMSLKPRIGLAAFDSLSNKLTSFDAKMYTPYNAVVCPLTAYGKNIYYGISGETQTIGDSARGPIAGIDTTTAAPLAFNPNPNYYYYENYNNSFSVSRNKLFVGGLWNRLANSVSPYYFAVFTLEPQIQASGLQVANLQPKSATVRFTRGSGEHRIVVIQQGGQPVDPADGKSYTANAGYKLGDSTGSASYVVYNGNDTAVNITKLTPNRNYTVSVYEYNGDGAACDYLTYPVLSATFTTPLTASVQKAVAKENAAIATGSAIYPNPVPGDCSVTFHAAAKQQYTIDVLDIKGDILIRKNVQAAKGLNKISLNTSNLAAGVYLVSIVDEKGNRENLKLVKQ